ncbi:MAG: MgtC/SapB family protein [Desulfuromonadaceae bacterium]|nr:MgtC/SapB family protein [Desulfuromonadaceae bacterium]
MAETFIFNEGIGAQLIKLLLAFIAGGLIGIEREKHGRPAGLRTHVLVCTGACLMMIISESIFARYGHLSATSIARIDPGRIGAQIVTGIGFLGAGVILKEGVNVRGLTTAACLWYVAGVGMAFGFGLIGIGICSTALAFAALFGLKCFDSVFRKDRFLRLSVVCAADVDIFEDLKDIFHQYSLRTTNIEQELDLENQRRQYDFIITHSQQPVGRALVAEISKLKGISKVRYK